MTVQKPTILESQFTPLAANYDMADFIWINGNAAVGRKRVAQNLKP